MEHAVAGWIAQGSYAGVFLLLVACGLGAPLSEEVIIVLGGVIVGHGHRGGFEWMMLTAYLGEVIGDALLFFVGRRLGPKAEALPRFRRLLTPRRVAWLERHFEQQGVWTIVGVRFVPGLRAPAFLMAGMGKMATRTFALADGGAALITAPALVYLGYHFGAHVLRGLAIASHWLILCGVAILLGMVAWGVLGRRRSREERSNGPRLPGPGFRSRAAG